MTGQLRQWEIVRVRVNASDRDEHPCVLVSPDEACADSRRLLNVLYGTTKRPARDVRPHEVILNGPDGLDHATVFSCAHLYTIDRAKISGRIGEVSPVRRRQLGRAIVAHFRLPLA
jgi:mRNA-degrading endonuclease toxin of MazEF toxin-antitoxin module